MASLTDEASNAAPAQSPRYTGVAIGLHWAIALSIIGLIFGGWFMTDLPDGHPLQYALYQFHKSIGITILVLTVARILWRVMNPPPPLPAGMARWETTASHLAHLGFYTLMVAMPLTGWLYVSTAVQFDVPTILFGLIPWPDLPFMGGLTNDAAHTAIEWVHSKLAWVMIALLALHVGGAVKHEITDEEGVLKRMIPLLFGKTAGPATAAKGAAVSFGGAAIVFAAIAGLPLMFQGTGPSSTAEAVSGANWQVDPATSEIAFSGIYNGAEYSGSFDDWSAEIAFYPEELDASMVEVAITAATIDTGNSGYNQSARGRDFFDVDNHPTISVTVADFAVSESDVANYTSTATLQVKEAEIEIPLDFSLEITGDAAVMTGSVDLLRETLVLGMGDDPGFDWLANEVLVEITVNATRTGG